QRWGVIAPEGPDGDRALEAISPLLALRASEQGAPVMEPYRVPPDMGLEQSSNWKNRVLRDERVPEAERPKYLLILGDLHQVSAELQQVLTNGSFVGRIHFADREGKVDPQGYESYAKKVVRWAAQPDPPDKPDALFFAAADGTEATE